MNLKKEKEDLESEILEVKKKKIFSELPDSLIKKALEKSKEVKEVVLANHSMKPSVKEVVLANHSMKPSVKEARKILRKYFGVFLTNRVLKTNDERILKFHISSRNRDYKKLYERIFYGGKIGSVIDLGCGVNGFSYGSLSRIINVNYIGVEAVGQLVSKMNKYFDEKNYLAKAIWADVFEVNSVMRIIKKAKKPRIIFMFNLLDALEFFERNFSKEFIEKISLNAEKVVLSFPTKSLSGGLKKASGKWIFNFVNKNFEILDDFEISNERFLIFKNKKN